MWNLLQLVFNAIGLFLLVKFFYFKWKDYQSTTSEKFWQFKRHKYIVTLGGMLAVVYLLVFYLPVFTSPFSSTSSLNLVTMIGGIIMSFAISTTWAVYLRRLDIYEPEKWIHIIVVFIIGCLTTFLVFPISDFIKNDLGFRLNGDWTNDFLYCTITIGMVEEFVKLIPLLIILRFKRIVNEPFDYLFYASVSALGFAFIENVLYIERSNFTAINARLVMSTVAHMTFSSVIGYAFMKMSYTKSSKKWIFIFGGFLLAATMHGFYDFWLINPTAQQFSGLSYLFYMLSVHYWFTLKNKAIRGSYFYDRKIKWVNDHLRYYLLTSLVVIFSFSVLFVSFLHGQERGQHFFTTQMFAYGFLMYYLAFSFSRFKPASRILEVCQLAVEKTIPNEPIPEKENPT